MSAVYNFPGARPRQTSQEAAEGFYETEMTEAPGFRRVFAETSRARCVSRLNNRRLRAQAREKIGGASKGAHPNLTLVAGVGCEASA